MTEALAELEQAVDPGTASRSQRRSFSTIEYLARQYTEAGQVDRGLALARPGSTRVWRWASPVRRAPAAMDRWMPSSGWEGSTRRRNGWTSSATWAWTDIWARASTCELLLARGDVEAAAPLVRGAAALRTAVDTLPDDRWVVRQVRLAALLDDAQAALVAATSYLVQLESCDSPLIAGVAARVGFQALALVGSMQGHRSTICGTWLPASCERARAGLTDEWRGGYYGVQLALAEGYAARVAGESAVEEFRVAVELAEPFGAFFALEPRLDLAQELLAHGGRDEGKELLVECWTAAHDMGAHGLEQRAFRLATRTRVPLPESATSEGPLSRLTPREREVLDQLATGATNKTIAGDALHQREDRERARVQPAGQARGREPRRGRRPRPGAGRLTRTTPSSRPAAGRR